MRSELSKYLNEDAKNRKKREQEQEEDHILREIQYNFEHGEILTIEDIKVYSKLLYKLLKDSYENKESFLTSYIDNEKYYLNKLKLGQLDTNQYINKQQKELKSYTIFSNEIQEKINVLDAYTKYLNYQINEHLNECNGHACMSNSIIKYKEGITEADIFCDFKGFCQDCIDTANYVDNWKKREYCDKCETCVVYRAEKKKVKAEKNKQVFYNKICNPEDIVKTNKYITNEYTQNIIINNPNITINTNILENGTDKFVYTKDRYFEIKMSTHGTTFEDQIDRLRYIFTYLMCGVDGRIIFPHEPKHSDAKSYPVTAAIYSLENEKGLPILHGLIRYKQVKKKSHTTAKQLQLHNQSVNPHHKPTTDIRMLNLWEDKKHYICSQDINNVVKMILESQYFGSDVNKFY